MKEKERLFRAVAALAAFVLLAQIASAITDPLNEEAAEGYFREKAAENYARLINAKIDELKNINNLILENPDLNNADTQRMSGYFVSILQPLYITAIIVIGIYLIFVSGTPGGRVRAKNSLWILLAGMAVLTVGSYILMVFYGISQAVTLTVLSLAPVNTQDPFIHAANYILEKGVYITAHKGASDYMWGVDRAGVPLLVIPYALLEGVTLILKLRFYVVAVLSIILPVTITIYAFLPTRGIGRLLLENTVLWTFAQVAMAGVLIIVAIGINLTSLITSFVVPAGLKFIMELAGLIMLTFTPLVFVRSFSRFLP